jgi:hypothetical protein
MSVRSAFRFVVVSVVALATVPVLVPGMAHATTTAVNCPSDNLQTALNNASSGDTLDVTGTCTGNFVMNQSLTLQGFAILDGNGNTVVTIAATVQNPAPVVNLNDLLLRFGGDLGLGGGGMRITGSATVTVTRVTVAAGLTSGPGAGIYNDGGTLSLFDSAVVDNLALASGGQGGGIYTKNGALSLTDSTVARNEVSGSGGPPVEGGGIFVDGSVTTLVNDTIAMNSASDAGGGTFLNSGSISATATIIQANGASSAGDCNGITTSGGYNLVGSTSGCSGFGGTDLQNVSANLQTFLDDNGGPTENLGLLAGSPALNAIPLVSGACAVGASTDQRGVPRPQGIGCDIGAVEKAHTTTAVSSSDATSTVGEDVTFTATVCPKPSAIPATPVGYVKFIDHHNHTASVLASDVLLVGGGGVHCAQAGMDTTSLTPGKHKIVARYSGVGTNFVFGGFFPSNTSMIQRVAQ